MTSRARIAIVGTGFSGLGMAIALKEEGFDDFVVFERAAEVGGTWRDNTYPGCQCDVPSHLYSFSFAMNPNWSRTYSTQPEIWRYLSACAHNFGVVPHIRFLHEVRAARWDGGLWRLSTSQGEWTADVLVSANGGLAEPRAPAIPGIESFEGEKMHSARFDVRRNLEGERVGVVGTGASAIQIVPKIQPEVAHLSVFQRTPGWIFPHTDRRITEVEKKIYRRFPAAQRAVRAGIYGTRELLVLGLAKDQRLVRPLRRVAAAHLYKNVKDPDLRKKLLPRYSPGCKRMLLSDDFYPALTRSNVELVTDPITSIYERGIVTEDGRKHELDVLIFATGFKVTDNPVLHSVYGKNGLSLADSWAGSGMRAYLGTTVAGFPNLFLMTGPNTGIGHTSLVVMVEAQIRYVIDALQFMDRTRAASVEVHNDAVNGFNTELQRKMRRTVWNAGGCSSWYLDEHGRNSTLWPDFTWRFRARTRRFDAENYEVVPAYAPGVADRGTGT